MTAESDLRAAEEQRCAALLAGDEPALAALLADDLVHIHLNGRVDDKAGYLAGFRDLYTFHAIRRGDLTIRLYGAVSVMTGPLIQSIELRATGQRIDVTAITTQVWLKGPKGWRLTTCHNAPVAGG